MAIEPFHFVNLVLQSSEKLVLNRAVWREEVWRGGGRETRGHFWKGATEVSECMRAVMIDEESYI